MSFRVNKRQRTAGGAAPAGIARQAGGTRRKAGAAGGRARRWGGRRATWYARRHYPYASNYTRYMPRNAASRSRYGATYASATAAQKAARSSDRMMGDGLYTGRRMRGAGLYTGRGGFWGSLGKGLLDVGQGMASDFNPALGAGIGLLRHATGTGMYSTAASNHIVNAGTGAATNDKLPVRVQAPTETGALVVSHTEFVSNIYAPDSTGFSKQEYLVNPGLESTFKWLSSMAGQYKEYELVQCIFSFKSTVSDFQTSHGVVGTIAMASEYNVGDRTAVYDTKQELMADISAVSNKVTKGLVFGVECNPAKLKDGGMKKLVKYIRTKGLRTHQDQEDFDWCRLTVATSDVPSELFNRCLGELHVTYTVKLQRPTIKGLQGGNISQSLWGRDNNEKPSVALTPPGSSLTFDLKPEALCESTSNAIDLEATQVPFSAMSSAATIFQDGSVTNPANVIQWTFPAQLEGTYEVSLMLHTDSDFTIKGFKVFALGNVTPIRDIWTGTFNGTSVAGQPNVHDGVCFDRSGVSTAVKARVFIKFHIRVQESTDGNDNAFALILDCTKASGASAEALIKNQYLSVVEYNTDFNEELTNRPEWVNSNSGTVIVTT